VRSLLVILAGVALVPLAQSAPPRPQASLSLTASSYRVLYGHGMTLAGRLSRTHAAGKAVTIDAWPYGRSAPVPIAVVQTNSHGRFSVPVKPHIRTTYWAHAGSAMSRKLTVGVAPALQLKVLANGHVRAHATAARSFLGGTIQLQRRSGGGWTTIARTKLGRHSTAVIVRSLPAGTIRLAMSVNQAGAGYLGATTHALRYRPPQLLMTPSAFKVLYGHRVMLTGRLLHGGAGRHVAIVAHPYGLHLVRVATATTGKGGRFSVIVTPRIMTTYQARLGSIRPSRPVTVGVRPLMSVMELANGSLRTRVVAAKTFRGRMVQLQRRHGSEWQTIVKRPLHGSTAIFTVTLPKGLVRVAMSVNQAGAGYLGSTSHALIYRAV